MPDQDTLVDRWTRRGRNNPVIAAIIVVGLVLTGLSGVYKALPDGLQQRIASLFTSQAAPTNGWAFVGMLDKADNFRWISQPKIEMVRQSGAVDRLYPFRIGDHVRVTKAMPQVIIDFKVSGTKNILSSPTVMRASIDPNLDYTGATYTVGVEYDVMDVDVNGYRGHDRVMWLRLVP